MAGKFGTLYGNLSIRNKLIVGFIVFILTMIVAIGVNVFVKVRITDPAHNSLYNSLQEITLSKELSYEFNEMHNMEQGFIPQYLAYGYTGVVELYQDKLPHVDTALSIIDELEVHGANNPGSEPGETADITTLRQSAAAYKAILSELSVKINQHGTVERDLGGNVILPLNQINEVVDASDALATATKYINTFDAPSALHFSDAITALKAEIKAADLPADQQTELSDLADSSQEAFRVLLTSDSQMIGRYMSLSPLGTTVATKIDEYVKGEEVIIADAKTSLDDAEKLQMRLTWVLAILSLMTTLGMAWLLSRSIAQPVMELTTIAQQIAAGDYNQRAAVRYSDETGQLAQSFNAMIGAVSDREAQLRDQTEKLRVATARAKEAARIKGEFLANVSHELRTPLNAIIGYSDMLTMGMCGELNEKQSQKIVRLRENGLRLLNLINDILDITRIEARRIEMITRPFAPHALFTRLSTQMEVLAHDKGLEFKTEIAPDLPETVMGDEKRIEQIVVNLLSNAFKFTQQGQVSLKVSTQAADNTWSFVVSDTGIGIPPHARDLIFEEFRQLDGASTRAYAGTGLGLAITRNLVRIMDGQISVDSELGRGSTFTVTLPLVVYAVVEEA